jgi:hypothetical protein
LDEAEALALLNEIADRLRVYAYRYSSGNVAKVVWDGAQRKAAWLMKQGDPALTTGVSVWRTHGASDSSVWLVIVCEDELDLRSRVTWGGGVEYELDEAMVRSLKQRHLSQMINQYDPETGKANFRAHYGLGADLYPGGVLRPRVAGE